MRRDFSSQNGKLEKSSSTVIFKYDGTEYSGFEGDKNSHILLKRGKIRSDSQSEKPQASKNHW